VSAHVAVPRKKEYASNMGRSVPKKPVLVAYHASPPVISTEDNLLGMLGILMVAAILASGFYAVVQYLM
jgi:hypothetical protein